MSERDDDPKDLEPLSLPGAIGTALALVAVTVILVLGVASWGVAGAAVLVGVGAALAAGLS